MIDLPTPLTYGQEQRAEPGTEHGCQCWQPRNYAKVRSQEVVPHGVRSRDRVQLTTARCHAAARALAGGMANDLQKLGREPGEQQCLDCRL
eukprot:358678-Prymnesium_polylepis.1